MLAQGKHKRSLKIVFSAQNVAQTTFLPQPSCYHSINQHCILHILNAIDALAANEVRDPEFVDLPFTRAVRRNNKVQQTVESANGQYIDMVGKQSWMTDTAAVRSPVQ